MLPAAFAAPQVVASEIVCTVTIDNVISHINISYVSYIYILISLVYILYTYTYKAYGYIETITYIGVTRCLAIEYIVRRKLTNDNSETVYSP